MALWASGVTPGARALDEPLASPPLRSERSGVAGTVSGMSSIWGVVVEVVELVLVLSIFGMMASSLVFSLMFGKVVDDVLAMVWIGVSMLVVVLVLVLVAIG